MKQKTALVLGGNGFIGHHLCRRLQSEGYWVRSVDIKEYEHGPNDYADEFVLADLRDPRVVDASLRLNERREYSFLPRAFEVNGQFDEVYQLAADMGGAGFVFTGEHDADIMHNSALINLNVLYYLGHYKFKGKIFYSSSACMYPQELQTGSGVSKDESDFGVSFSLAEYMAYPANPDSEYGWEKLFSERLFLAYARNYGLNVRIARFHNIYGPEGTYKGGREKAPAAMCRKVIESYTETKQTLYKNHATEPDGFKETKESFIEVWGDGQQTRSFLYIDDCIDAVRLLMESDFKEPINIGSEEMISINGLAKLAIAFSGKDIQINNVPSNAIGVKGRNSNNDLIRKVLNWEPKYSLKEGLEKTFNWIKSRYENI